MGSQNAEIVNQIPVMASGMDEKRFYEEGYARPSGVVGSRELVAELASEIIKRGSRILDIGCGEGSLMYLIKKIKAAEICDAGVDMSRVFLKRNLGVTHPVQSDANFLPFKKSAFDLVILNHLLEHLFSPEKCLQEVVRVLSQNGKVIIGVPNTVSLKNRLLFLKGDFSEGVLKEHHSYFTFKTLRGKCEENGLKIKRLTGFYWEYIKLPMKVKNSIAKLIPRFSDELIVICEVQTDRPNKAEGKGFE